MGPVGPMGIPVLCTPRLNINTLHRRQKNDVYEYPVRRNDILMSWHQL